MTGLRLLLVETGGTVLAAAMPGKIKTFQSDVCDYFLTITLDFAWANSTLRSFVFTIYSGYDLFSRGSAYVFKGTFGSK